jgi:hypothetical protein
MITIIFIYKKHEHYNVLSSCKDNYLSIWFIEKLCLNIKLNNIASYDHIQERYEREMFERSHSRHFIKEFHSLNAEFWYRVYCITRSLSLFYFLQASWAHIDSASRPRAAFKLRQTLLNKIRPSQWEEVVWDSDSAMIETTTDRWKIAERERKRT